MLKEYRCESALRKAFEEHLGCLEGKRCRRESLESPVGCRDLSRRPWWWGDGGVAGAEGGKKM